MSSTSVTAITIKEGKLPVNFFPISLEVSEIIRIFATDYEKSRNEKSRNMENPFKFGTIVEAENFTDRIEEVAYISHFVDSANHLILISPRRFGKSSVVAKAVKESGRKSITVNLQQVTSVADLSAKLLREFFKVSTTRSPVRRSSARATRLPKTSPS